MGTGEMTPPEVVEHRLHNHHLSGAPISSPHEVVGWFAAMQAQDYPGAKWSIGVRTAAISDGDIDRALAEGTILRTHILRPTWHFVLPSDIRWVQQLTASRVHSQMAYYRRSLGLDEAMMVRSNALIATALREGQRLTRTDISALLSRAGIVVDGVRLGHLLMRAELDLVICSGGLRGRQQTYALMDERVPTIPAVPREEALAELTRRYYTSHGPATDRDFSWWSGLTLADVRLGLALASPHLDSATIADRTYWFNPTLGMGTASPPAAHLLQGYDEFVIAYSQSRDLIDLAGVAIAGADERLRIHVVILDGQAVARWRRVSEARSLTVDASLERPVSASELRAVEGAVERYAAFVGLPVRLALAG
jgi:hypothetical protein